MVYEMELNFDSSLIYHDMPDDEVEANFLNIEAIRNRRCSKFKYCFNYALDSISRKILGYFLDGCIEGFEFLEEYFEQIAIEDIKRGDIITYHEVNDFKSEYEIPCSENCRHFAIVEKSNQTLDSTIVKSKWGSLGVFKGLINDMPDIYGNSILIWRKK